VDNYLVAFNYKQESVTLKANEALWPFIDGRFQLRFTRAQVGRIFGSKDGQKHIDMLCSRYPHLDKLGMPMEVVSYQEDTPQPVGCPTPKISGRRHKYTVLAYNIDEVYYFAIESTLQGSRKYLRLYPHLKEQIAKNTIKPPAIEDIKPEILAFFGIPYKERGAFEKKACEKYGWSHATFYRKVDQASASLGITKGSRKSRADKGSYANRPEYKKVITYKKANPEATAVKIKDDLNIDVSTSRITAWLRDPDPTLH